MKSRHVPSTVTDRKDRVAVQEDSYKLEDDRSSQNEVMIRTPSVYSWGRCDTNALLRSYNEPPAIDGVQVLTFANNRTIMQVKLPFVELVFDRHYSHRFWNDRMTSVDSPNLCLLHSLKSS